MTDATVARRLLEVAAAAGSEHVFGLPGVHNLALWREQAEGLPQVVGVRHEQAAVYAADGCARATARPAFAFVTTGPGAANAVGAFGEAAASRSPVVLVATEVSTRLRREGVVRGLLHESRDQAALFEPLAKRVFRPRSADAVIDALEEAVLLATSSPTGPVYVDVPTDLLDAPARAATLTQPAPVRPNAAELAALVATVDGASDVVIWAGSGVIQADAASELTELAERLGAPVVTTFGARGCLPAAHPLAIEVPPHEPEVAERIARADLLLAIGSDFDGIMTRHWRMPLARQLAVVNCDAADLRKNYSPDVAVLGDAKLAIRALLDSIARKSQHREQGHDLTVRVRRRLAGDTRTRVASLLLDAIETNIDERTTVVNDMAIPAYWSAGYVRLRRPRQQLHPMGWGTLGYALPASIGAALGRGGPVLVICGDGGFMFAVGELATIAQQRLPVTILLVDDGGYGMLRFDQDRAGDEHRGVDLTRPDFALLAESFGIVPTTVPDMGESLAVALKAALASGVPNMILSTAKLYPPRTASARWHE